MKTKTSVLVVAIVLLVMTFLPQFNTLGIGAAFQQPETAWVVWETDTPIQRVAWDGSTIWAGAYKGGLSQWQLEAGQVAGYTTENGLSGNHVTSIAVDGSGQKWLALLDGSLNNTVNGSTFINLTPAGMAGKNAWDVAASGDDVWLATLGGGVSRYSSGTWTTYNTSNSSLLHNDVYAVVVDSSGTPWVGTVNYGVAALQNGDWVSYSLPVQIANPASQGALVSNQAVTDIAVDSSGNKWFATDGSGVARLDSSNTNWTVYDTSNSGLASNFIQSIHIDAQGNLWYGTLSGGVSRLSADGASWFTYNSGNTPLPEDDILDIATDSQGGLWLAAYDSGLAYYGRLPASTPTFELDLFQKPEYRPGKVKGYYVWVDPVTYEWTLSWSGDGKDHTFTGEILADSSITYLSNAGLEAGDSVNVNGNSLTVNASEASGEDSVTFKPALDVTELTIRLMIDGAYYPYNIHLGGLGETPGTAPFKVAAVQPIPPTVTVPADLTVNEGDFVLLSGDFTDPDSPTGHTIAWDLGDGTSVPDELTVDHIYPDEGSFTAQLTVTDVHGLISTGTTNITVQNVVPDVDFYYYPFVVDPSEEITFTGYFYDPGTLDTHTITWDFGDGSAPVTTTELTITHTYAQTGTYTATLTVADNDGGVGVATFEVEVVDLANNSPQFDLGQDVTVDEGSQFTRSVAFTDSDSTEWQLTIDYGDGTAPTQTTLSAEGNMDLAHVYAEDGTYTLSVTLNDNEGGETSDSILVTVANVSPVVNAGADQSVNVNATMALSASFTDSGIQDNHTATIDWGDGNSEPVSVTPTGAGTGTVSAQHAYASTGNFTVEVCVTDSDSGTGCDTILVEVNSSGTGTTEIKIGETFILPYDDYGNGDLMVAQHTTLSQEATIQSLSFYVTQAAGNLRLGIYDDANGNPGALVAKTDEFTPVVGWNTQSVQTPVLLPPGSYWLAFLPESDEMHGKSGWPGSSQETGRYYSYPYGEMPATFSSSPNSGEFQFSFYATFTVAAEPGTVYVGEVNVLHADAGESSNLLIAQQTQLTHTATVQSLSFFVTNAVGKLRLGIYDDGWDGPGALMAKTDEFTPVVGWNTVSVQIPTLLPAGTYWLAFLPESDDLWFKYEWVPGLYTGRIYGYPFGEMPSMVTDQPIGVEYRYSFYATFIEDNSVYTPATALLDDFNRADGAIGSNWSGETSEVGIASNQLTVNSFDTTISWNNEPFGADQEAYLTFSQLNTSAYNDQGLALKMQSNGTLEDGALIVSYDGGGEHLHVYTYDDTQGWAQHGNDIYVTFTNGDLLGVRARADGIVEVYRNEELVAVRNITSWPYYAQGGYIGLSFYAAEGAVVDDFGGGTLPGGEMMMASAFSTFEAGPQPEGTIEFSVMSSQFNPETDLDPALLQTTSTVSGQTAYVTIARESAGEIVLDRSQSHRNLKDGDLRVLFDMAGNRIQVLKYDSQRGWAQVGKDISVRFKDGERFRIILREEGALEIYRNGKLLTRQKLSSLPQQDVSAAAMPPSTIHDASFQQVSYRPTISDSYALNLPPLVPLPELPLQQTTSLTIDYTYALQLPHLRDLQRWTFLQLHL